MSDAVAVAREWAQALMARAPWAEEALAAFLATALESDRRALILECCRAACEDCRNAEPERIEEDGGSYYLHRPEGVELLIECRGSDIRAALLDRTG
jgi:hypothetical protein